MTDDRAPRGRRRRGAVPRLENRELRRQLAVSVPSRSSRADGEHEWVIRGVVELSLP